MKTVFCGARVASAAAAGAAAPGFARGARFDALLENVEERSIPSSVFFLPVILEMARPKKPSSGASGTCEVGDFGWVPERCCSPSLRRPCCGWGTPPGRRGQP